MHLHTFLVIYTSHLSCSKLRFTLVCSLDNFSFSLFYALIHTGRRRQCLSFTLNGVLSSVAEVSCGFTTSLALLAAEVENFSNANTGIRQSDRLMQIP